MSPLAIIFSVMVMAVCLAIFNYVVREGNDYTKLVDEIQLLRADVNSYAKQMEDLKKQLLDIRASIDLLTVEKKPVHFEMKNPVQIEVIRKDKEKKKIGKGKSALLERAGLKNGKAYRI